MKRLLSVIVAATLLLIPAAITGQSAQDATGPPPVAPALVREGDFAISLVETLELGTASSEAQAESMLLSMGIAPKNGWVADYPMTPDIIGELQEAVVTVADSGRLAMDRTEAVKAFQSLTADYGLPVARDIYSEYGEYSAPDVSGQYPDPNVANSYYDEEGPPVVTYYSPPWDYYYLYSWVPYPFWWGGFGFSGFFVLNDFDRDCKVVTVRKNGKGGHRVIHNSNTKVVSNHWKDRNTHRVGVIDPATRNTGRQATMVSNSGRQRGFNSQEARAGAASILERSRERAPAAGNVITNRGNAISNPNRPAIRSLGAAQEHAGVQRGSDVSSFQGRNRERMINNGDRRRMERGPSEVGRNAQDSGFVGAPRNFGNRGQRNVERSYSSEGRSFRAPASGGGDSFRSNRGGGGVSLGRGDFSRGGGNSFRGGSGSSSGGGSSFRGGGGMSIGGGGFSRGGGGGGCRGRC